MASTRKDSEPLRLDNVSKTTYIMPDFIAKELEVEQSYGSRKKLREVADLLRQAEQREK